MQSISISNETLRADVLTWGASLQDLRLKHIDRSLVVGLDDPRNYPKDPNYLGAIIGRYGNRIKDGVLEVDGVALELEKNDLGKNHLHGGNAGFGRRHWRLTEHGVSHAVFTIDSADGDAQYPGNLEARVTYEIIHPSTLRLTIDATSDRTTPINICHHPYFTFSDTVHHLEINASTYLPSDETLIPTGAQASVDGGKFDFKTSTPIGEAKSERHRYNNTYCLHDRQSGPISFAARLKSQDIAMEVWTTQPGIHLYDAYKLSSEFQGPKGQPILPSKSVCLEAQAWPNSPNEDCFPNTMLRPGQLYSQTTEYRFSD